MFTVFLVRFLARMCLDLGDAHVTVHTNYVHIHSFQVGRFPTLPLCRSSPANSKAFMHSGLLSSLRFATPILYTHTPQITHILFLIRVYGHLRLFQNSKSMRLLADLQVV